MPARKKAAQAAPKKSASKKKSAEAPPKEEPKSRSLTLPAGVTKGSGIVAMFSAAESKARGYEEPEFEEGEEPDFLDGSFHGLIESISKKAIKVTWVFPSGDEPTSSVIDLEEGRDEAEGCAVLSIEVSPIPRAQLMKWRAAGLAAASARDEEDEEEGEDEEDDENDENGDDEDEVDYE